MGRGEITEFHQDHAILQVVPDTQPPEPLLVTLILALPRPKILKRVVQCATVMGVKQIVLIKTWKVDKSYWQSPVLTNETLRHEMILGLEQAGDTILPVISQYRLFKPFVEDNLDTISRNTRALTIHPGASGMCPHNVTDPLTIAIGPERGFIPYEIEMLESRGFQTVHMGSRILRVDHAIPAVLGRLYHGP